MSPVLHEGPAGTRSRRNRSSRVRHACGSSVYDIGDHLGHALGAATVYGTTFLAHQAPTFHVVARPVSHVRHDLRDQFAQIHGQPDATTLDNRSEVVHSVPLRMVAEV